ncbi:hypothetical protein KUTeg_008446 [Tegillarca granosa]|uniref:Glycerol kinase n=1 Tax=Tegillarca granosa TaxID=220873 RepID=A0ABQ9FC91_TEGGR|nr:hypothetical protein KUTeg_008446 [Tegillarca granosa]
MTGGPNGGEFKTDLTNVGHSGLLNLTDIMWDKEVCKFFNIPLQILPTIHSTSEVFGYIADGPLAGIPISGMIGDQLGATVGQMCFKPGQSKCTYGTGGCIIVNTDTEPVYSRKETLASSVDSTHDCYFVPALQGYFFPFWEDDARGYVFCKVLRVIVGISNYTKREHIARAALEAVAYQIKQAFDAISEESGHTINSLRVDGGMIVNNFLMQFQSDLIGVEVVRPYMKESSSLGAAIMAGAADGINIFKVNGDKKGIDVIFECDTNFDVFKPQIDENERKRKVQRWLDAVERSLHWKTK